jgi:HK97 family phage portal protein
MNLLERIKAVLTKTAFTDDKPPRFTSASGMTFLGREVKRPDFSHKAAVQYCASWVYAAARLNAIAVASQPLRLYVRSRGTGAKLWNTRRTDRRTKAYLSGDLAQLPSRFAMSKAAEFGDDYEAVTDNHPLLDLLTRVNPYQNGFDATVLRVLYLELTGNAYVHPVIDRRLGIPAELWTMPSQWVEIMPGDGARGEPFVRGYRYGSSDHQKTDFTPEEVIHFKYPNPRDMYYGLGKVEAAWGAVTSNEALHEMDYFFFKNKSRPDYLAVIKGNASEAELDRFTAEVENKIRGTQKTGKFLAVTGDVDLKPLSFPPKDLEGREEIVEEIAAIFGVPVSMLRANDPNLASAEVGFASWKETTILPACRMDEDVLNQSLLPLFGIEEDAFLAYDNPVKRDEVQESTKRLTYVQGGIITANEARQQEGLEPIEDPNADRLLINGQVLGAGAQIPFMAQRPNEPTQSAPMENEQTVTEDLAASALNGAQVTSLVELATSAASGILPLDSVRSMAAAAFPAIPRETIDAIFDPIVPRSLAPVQESPDAPEVVAKAIETKDALGDCVSAKIPKLLDEGYPQDQAVAIAYAMCSEGKGLEEAIGKAVEGIDTKPPESVAANARRALEVRESKPESQRGMTEVGIARARDLSNRANLSEDTIRRMLAYFERHEVDKQGETWDDQGKGWQAWNGWGGDEGFSWARRKVEEFDRAHEKKSCGCGCKSARRISQKAMWESGVSDGIHTKSAESESRKINKNEEEAAKAVSAVFDKQVSEILALLKAAERPSQELITRAERVLRARGYQREIVAALSPYLREAITTGATIGIDTVAKLATEVDFQLERDDLARYADTESVRLARQTASGVTETTAVRVRDILGDGLEKGENVDKLAERVQTWADSQKDQDGTWSRATTVARTEAQRAARVAEVEAWKSTGLVRGKTWLLAPDPCEFCEAVAKVYETNAIGLDEAFFTKGSVLTGADGGSMVLDYEDIKGAPLHPNCRCSMQPLLDDDLESIYQEIKADELAAAARRITEQEGNQ